MDGLQILIAIILILLIIIGVWWLWRGAVEPLPEIQILPQGFVFPTTSK